MDEPALFPGAKHLFKSGFFLPHAMSKPKNNTLTVAFLTTPAYDGKLVYVKSLDSLFLYQKGKYYRPVDISVLRRDLWAFLANNYPEAGITDSLLSDIIKQIPSAIPSYIPALDDHYVAFDDCLLDTADFSTHSFDPLKVAMVYVPIPYSSIDSAPCPTWLSFLDTVFVHEDDPATPDRDTIELVQEMLGYMLIPQMYAEAAFFLIGNGSNGKSTLVNVLTSILGNDAISSYSIEALTTRPFTVAALIGKRLNICSEEESKFIRADKFKALVSGELTSAERKYGHPFEFRPTTKFLFCTNEMPSFNEINYGLKRRVKIIPFFRKFSDKDKDIFMSKKLAAELPGIIYWAFQGLHRFIARNYTFSTASVAMQNSMTDFVESISSPVMFFNEHYKKDEDGAFITNEALYKHYTEWCDVQKKKYWSKDRFGKELNKNLDLPSIVRRSDGRLLRGRACVRVTEETDFMSSQFTKPPFL